jgi:hypothetical protein
VSLPPPAHMHAQTNALIFVNESLKSPPQKKDSEVRAKLPEIDTID